MPADVVLKRIALDDVDLSFKPPECLTDYIVQWNVAALRCGQKLETVVVQFDQAKQRYYLRDGFNRVEAYKLVGRKRIYVQILSGTYEELCAEWEQARPKA